MEIISIIKLFVLFDADFFNKNYCIFLEKEVK